MIDPTTVVLFPLPPDWSKPIKETTEYLTDVLVAYSDAEQRRGLRANPRRSLAFAIATMSSRETAVLDALLFAGQPTPFGVPWWPDAIRLATDVPASSTTIPLDPSNRLFATGGLAVLWQSAFANEVVAISNTLGNGLSLTAGTRSSWTANKTIVLPVFLALLGTSVDLSRFSSGGVLADLAFAGEAGQVAPLLSSTPAQYRGLDVLEVSPNWGEQMKRTIKRSMIVLDSKTGDLAVEPKSSSPIASAPLPWWITGHDAIANFRAFFDRRKGRLVPFFVPTWDQDLLLASDVQGTDATIRIVWTGYTRYLFPSVARRDLAFLTAGGPRAYARVTIAIDNGDGTETLTLSAPIGTAFAATATQVSFLILARLDSDSVEIDWTSNDFATVTLGTVEVPREVPA